MKPEERARQQIDGLLESAGWAVQDYDQLNLGASLGVAVREYPLQSGDADYLLFVDRTAFGAVEAKPEGFTLGGVAGQSQKYVEGLPKNLPQIRKPLPFAYESTGVETFFRDLRDPEPLSRSIFSFHSPETLQDWAAQENTLRKKLTQLPPLNTEGLRRCQVDALRNLEESFAETRPRALIQMASGAGKTFTAVTFIYRLIKFAGAKRILFLVDRNNLARQTNLEFQKYVTPDDGRKFTELYNVQHLRSNTIDPVSKVSITTIQRLYSMLKGDAEFEEEIEEHSLFETSPEEGREREVSYNPKIPIDTFDFIVTDECHRSIYHLWRQVLEYFDAFVIGLTATPSKQTLGFFNKNLVTEYGHDRAVADGVNVGYDVYRIKTAIGEGGSTVEADNYVDKRDKLTRRVRWEKLDEDLVYSPAELDRNIVAPDQIRTVIKTFRERLFTEIFPGRTEVPKTLIFAKDDSHAEDIVTITRNVFGKGNEFCKKITYRTTGEKPENLIASFRNSYNPRIVVAVDMISTGTDIRPLECLIFMRDVKSGVYFEQMKGRGTRTVSSTDLQAVTPDATIKTHFVIVDAVGVSEGDKTDSRPLERKPNVRFDKLVRSIGSGIRDTDSLTSLAGRLARLDRKLSEKDRMEIEQVAKIPIRKVINRILDALDPDSAEEQAREMFSTESPTRTEVQEAARSLVKEACSPFDSPEFRNALIEVHQRNEQTIDTVSGDTATFTGYDPGAKERATAIVDSFRKFIEENRDELTALQIIYGRPFKRRKLTYEEIKELAEAIEDPPLNLTPETVWKAYGQLDKSRVKGAGPQKLLANIISLVRFALGQIDTLEPFSSGVDRRFSDWLAEQERGGKQFTKQQKEWLGLIKEHIATSLTISTDDFEYEPFYEKGGIVRAGQVFGQELPTIMNELNEVLVP